MLVFLLLIICLSFALFIYTPIGSILGIGLESVLIKLNIDNPYVDCDYCGWKNVSINNDVNFCIPEDWLLHEGSVCYLYDSSGQIWAYGTLFDEGKSEFSSYKAFLESITSTQFTKISFESFTPIHMMDGSDVDKIIAYSDESVSWD